MSRYSGPGVLAEIRLAKNRLQRTHDALLKRMQAAHELGMYEAGILYAEQLAALEKIEGALKEDATPSRPPTWKDAVLVSLGDAPAAGKHVSEILEDVQAMGVTTAGEKTASDPLLLVDNALYRLGDKVVKVGPRRWTLNVNPEGSSRNDEMGGSI